MSKNTKPADGAAEQPTSITTPGSASTESETKSMDAKPSETKPADGAPKAEIMTPDEWGKKLGRFRKADPNIPQQISHFDWQHAAADKLYGWSEHAYNFQDTPFQITRECYEKALAAAAQFPAAAPHPGALPNPYKKRFAGFVPKRALTPADKQRAAELRARARG